MRVFWCGFDRWFVVLIFLVVGVCGEVVLAAGDGAVLVFQPSRRLRIGQVEGSSKVYLDREDRFERMPAYLHGMAYTLGARGIPMTAVRVRVQESGWIYLLIHQSQTPEGMGLRGGWEKMEQQVDGPAFRGSRDWDVYRREAEADEVVVFTRCDPPGFAVIAGRMVRGETETTYPKRMYEHATYFKAGESVQGREIGYWVFGERGRVVFVMASIHGDEFVGTPLTLKLGDYLDEYPKLYEEQRVILMPKANPDGVASFRRFNQHNVDLNRNFVASNRKNSQRHGEAGLSEPEAQAIQGVLDKFQPEQVLSLHQYPLWLGQKDKFEQMLDYDGPGGELAERMAKYCDLPVNRLGSFPGSMGSYVGVDMGKPIITVELSRKEYNLTADELWEKYGKMLLAGVVYPKQLED